jgi:L-alanine-DL-glutamate epimerase-like enolase superfamily enzyme
MKITDIKISDTFYVPCKAQQDAITTIPALYTFSFCQIFTDEGLTGFVPSPGGSIAKALIEEALKPYVVGENPMNNERIWSKMYWGMLTGGRRGSVLNAIGIVDNAIWDLKGKITGQPLHKLLGGFQDSVNSYGSGINLNLSNDELVAQMSGFVKAGFKMVKMKIGHRDPAIDLERVRCVREAIGAGIDLSLDVNNAWSLTAATHLVRQLEPFNIYWLEEPILADEISSLAKLADKTSIPIAAGENHYTKWEFKDLIEQGAVQIVQADVTKCGGLTEYLKIAAMADAHGLPVCPHHSVFTDVPGVAAIPNGLFHEYAQDMFEPASRLLVDFAAPVNGMISPLDKPGFGIELDPVAAQMFSQKPEQGQTQRTTVRGWRWPPYL